MADRLLDALNPEQRKAVTARDGAVLVLAGAGSGKTRVIAHRIAYLLAVRHVSPASILAVTFTNKAAEEMRGRVLSLLDKPALPFLWIGTFHAMCARILRADVEALGEGFTRDFTILDADDTLSLIRRLLKDRGISERNFQPRTVLSALSRLKCDGLSAAAFAEKAHGHFQRTLAPVYEAYERQLLETNCLDFDDLLLLALRLLEEREEVRKKYQSQFHHILVDEYQDTNRIQYRLLKTLSGRWGNLFAVGDEDQSIYRWRGADLQNILDFQRDFPGAEVIKLERNYRSTTAILEAANGLVAHNTRRIGKHLWTERKEGPPVRLFAALSDREEAAFVADSIREQRARYAWRQMAVLYRTNAQSRSFEEAFLNRRIPYQVVGGLKFYERKEVKDVLAYLRAALNPQDRLAVLRILNVPPRGIGPATAERLEALAAARGVSLAEALALAGEEGTFSPRAAASLRDLAGLLGGVRRRAATEPPSQVVGWLLEASGYLAYLAEHREAGPDPEARIENVRELVSALREFETREGGDLRLFLERQALASDQDDLQEGGHDAVRLMTLHAAKGLEFPVVFLAGLEQDLCPHLLSSQTEEGVEEERRLCYVGMTRAMDSLTLTWARQRYVFGVVQDRLPSPFLREIPPSRVEEVRGLSPAPSRFEEAASLFQREAERPEAPRGKVLRVGARVHHKTFGFGIVLALEGEGPSQKVTVSFNRFGRKRLAAAVAKLEVV